VTGSDQRDGTADDDHDHEPAAGAGPAPGGAFPVVGIGASAGGLDALEHFFAQVPPDPGMAFVVVTHSQPGRASLLPQILGRQTAMPIREVNEPTPVAPDHVYIAPSGRLLTIERGVLLPAEAPEHGPRALPIDHFFRSLAADRGEHAVGVVLSGTGSDGTIGIKEIKGASGMVMTQEEGSARYPSMPHSAAALTLVDYVLPPGEMPTCLVAYVDQRRARAAVPTAAHDGDGIEDLKQIFLLLRRHVGHDFSAYKPSTLRRRIERRMNVHRLATAPDYARLLQKDPGELDVLFHELLINVTSFFRDPAAFSALGSVLSALVAELPPDHTIRAWVPGCSTGEEAYTIAMLLREALDGASGHNMVQVFATDLDQGAIEVARAGIYPASIAADVGQPRLERFFVAEGGAYRIRKDLRETVVFAPQNLITDPPFTRLDLLSCRNLLIYLSVPLQARILPLFHYALRTGGTLMLGSSEGIGPFSELFDAVDKKWKIFRRRANAATVYPPDLVPTSPRVDARPLGRSTRHIADAAPPPAPVQHLLFDHLVPPSLLVTDNGDIVHIHGRTGELLEMPPGPLTHPNALAMARDGLALELGSALHAATALDGVTTRPDVRIKANGHWIRTDLRVERIRDPGPFAGLFLVAFERVRPDVEEPEVAPPDAPARIAELRRELQQGREMHQVVIEELEAANEELKSTNEELQSTNEELQSTNEELETSKEEMQSLNEELQTVNAELQDNLDQLARTNDDIKNLLDATDIATVFLDERLRIKRFTEQARHVIPLIPSDVGRPIADLVPRLRYDALSADAEEVLRTLAPSDTEVRSEDGRWYLIRIRPYRTGDNVIDGLVITFVDVTRVTGLVAQAAAVVEALAHTPTTIFGLDLDLRYTWACGPVLGVTAAQVIGKTSGELFPSEIAAHLDAAHQAALTTGAPVRRRLDGLAADPGRCYDLYLEPQRDSTGAVTGLSGVMTRFEPTEEAREWAP
jgi:two-component system, chemotaxis family, CheB/CheR fusion protein